MLDEMTITKSEKYGIAEMNDKEKELYEKSAVMGKLRRSEMFVCRNSNQSP
jgi:hypothetical protein